MIEGWTQVTDEKWERVKAPLGGLFRMTIHAIYNTFAEQFTYVGVLDNYRENVYSTPPLSDFNECVTDLETWYFSLVTQEYMHFSIKKENDVNTTKAYDNFIRREYGRIEYGI